MITSQSVRSISRFRIVAHKLDELDIDLPTFSPLPNSCHGRFGPSSAPGLPTKGKGPTFLRAFCSAARRAEAAALCSSAMLDRARQVVTKPRRSVCPAWREVIKPTKLVQAIRSDIWYVCVVCGGKTRHDRAPLSKDVFGSCRD